MEKAKYVLYLNGNIELDTNEFNAWGNTAAKHAAVVRIIEYLNTKKVIDWDFSDDEKRISFYRFEDKATYDKALLEAEEPGEVDFPKSHEEECFPADDDIRQRIYIVDFGRMFHELGLSEWEVREVEI